MRLKMKMSLDDSWVRCNIFDKVMQRYKVDEFLGEGSFGSVYLVHNEQGQKFAYKRIKVNPFQAEQAERQIDIMRKFIHPHLVRVYQHSLDGEKEELHIIMEYCQGGDLAQLINKNKLSPETILSILQQIVTAFAAMSAKGVMHRDLKPENILLTKEGTIKIADFGCAKCVEINNLSLIDSRSMEKGSYLYVSPQQLKLEKYSFKCDVWAAGCIAFLLEYGKHPFIEANPHNVLQEINKTANSQPLKLSPSTHPAIATFITLTLYYEDSQRASWRELQLCRLFYPRIKDIDGYLAYLRQLSPFVNAIVKQFWKVHKTIVFPNALDQILIYYLIKFEMSNLKMCLKILKKTESMSYLFEEGAFKAYDPREETFNDIKKSYLQYQKYFNSIKKTIQNKECFIRFINPYECKRPSAFVDLDKSIRTCYKILHWIQNQLHKYQCKGNRVWVLLARWINFEKWFSFEKKVNFEKIMCEPQGNVLEQIREELKQFQSGLS